MLAPLPSAPACARNRDPLLKVLRDHLTAGATVLEIGSGTGEHGVYFAQRLPAIVWQPSDLESEIDAIDGWRRRAALKNLRKPMVIDAVSGRWPVADYDVVFTANTTHIMPWAGTRNLFANAQRLLGRNGSLIIYGPFRESGNYRSDGDQRFDARLRAESEHMGIRDLEHIGRLADEYGLQQSHRYAMPANNLALIWRSME